MPAAIPPVRGGGRDSVRLLRVLRQSFATVDREYSDLELPVRGTLPAGLNGVLYRNGPGRMERGGREYGHLFDGDGHVCRFEFAGGKVRYRNRFVRTQYFEREERAGRILYRCFGTNRPGGMLANFLQLEFRNPANTNVIRHGERLLALYEGGPPYELDPATLATRGVWALDHALPTPTDGVSRLLPPLQSFTAHPTTDPQTGDLIGFAVLPRSPNQLLTYRIDKTGRLRERRCIELGRRSFVHDALVTKHWMLFLLPSLDYDIPGVLFGCRSAIGSMTMHTDRPMQVLLVPRGAGEPVRFDTIPGFVFHFAGGDEHDDGSVHANIVHHACFPTMDSIDDLMTPGEAMGRLTRLDIDPKRRRSETALLSEHAHELPTVGHDPSRIFSCAVPSGEALPFFSAIAASDLAQDGRSARTHLRDFFPDLPGEPIPVRAEGEDWLLTLVYRADARRTDLLVLNAGDLTTAAEIPLPHSLPPGFHGSWVGSGSTAPE